MSFDAHKNFSITTVVTAPSPAISGTTLIVVDGTVFPAVPFNAAVWPTNAQPSIANAEIVRVIGITLNTLTITRTQESTPARTIVLGDQIGANITVKTLTDLETLQKVVALVDGATVALDASQGSIFTLSAAGDRTLAAPTNPIDGQKIIIRHTASGGSNRSLTLNAVFRFGSDISALSGTISAKTDYIGCVYNATASVWDVVAYVKGY